MFNSESSGSGRGCDKWTDEHTHRAVGRVTCRRTHSQFLPSPPASPSTMSSDHHLANMRSPAAAESNSRTYPCPEHWGSWSTFSGAHFFELASTSCGQEAAPKRYPSRGPRPDPGVDALWSWQDGRRSGDGLHCACGTCQGTRGWGGVGREWVDG